MQRCTVSMAVYLVKMNYIFDFWDSGKLSMHVSTWLQAGMVKCFALYRFLFKVPERYLIDTAYDS